MSAMARSSESLASRDSGSRLPFAVRGLERVAAPAVDVFVERYLRPGRPVVLTGLTEG